MSLITIEGIRFFAFHGVHPVEQKMGRIFMVDVYAHLDVNRAAIENKLELTIDYEKVATIVKVEMKITEALIETLVRRISWSLWNELEILEKLEVRVTKSAPLVGLPLNQVSVDYRIEKQLNSFK